MSELAYKRTNVYETADERKLKEIFDYAEGYRAFIDAAKTEREACDYVAEEAEKRGYKPFKFGAKLKAGDRVYYNNRGKNIYLIKVGTADIARDGIRIVASHIDSPRVDLKQVPLYESDGVALAKTHYYGGIRKYQWAAIPLALHGRIVRADGTAFDVKIGEDDNDPVFYISDLLPHLAAKQNAKPLGEGLGGEDLNIWLGNMPYTAAEEDKDKTVKENLLRILHEKYGVREEDFLSAELSLVPAFRAKDVGFDRGLMAAYGHDDRVCSYPAYTALFDEEPEKPVAPATFSPRPAARFPDRKQGRCRRRCGARRPSCPRQTARALSRYGCPLYPRQIPRPPLRGSAKYPSRPARRRAPSQIPRPSSPVPPSTAPLRPAPV